MKDELAKFLRSRRARLSPTDLGLPVSGSRRTPGLRREEVAAVAGVGLSWFTRLEQGRDIAVSTPFLERIAAALKLNDEERDYLFHLAHNRPPPARKEYARPFFQAQTLLDLIETPAYARTARFDVVAWNSANTTTFGDFTRIAPEDRNILWLMFTRPHYRKTMPNWELDAKRLVAKLRIAFVRAGGTPYFTSLTERLAETSIDFRRMWETQDVTASGEGTTLYISPRLGIMKFDHFTLVPDDSPELYIVLFVSRAVS